MANAHNCSIGAAGSAGKGLFATKTLKPGEVIFELKRPLVTALDTPALDYACEWCFDGVGEAALGQAASPEQELKLFRCSGCKLVKYCSKNCQAQAWKHHHKLECKIFASLMPRVLPNAPRMLVQLLLRKNKGAIDGVEWNRFLALQHHVYNFRRTPPQKGDRQKLQITAVAGKQYGGSSEGMDYFEELAARMYINTQTLVNPIFHPLGQCLDPLPSSINHSCMPNAVVVFSGPVMTLRATTDIPSGKEVTISYIDPSTNKSIRQAELSDRYFFECKCEQCLQNLVLGQPVIPSEWTKDRTSAETMPILKSLKDLDTAALGHQKAAESALIQSRASQGTTSSPAEGVPDSYYLELCKGLSKYLQQENLDCYPPGRQPLAKIRFETIIELLARSLFVPALILSLQNYFDVDPWHFPFVCHPVRVVHVYTLSKLAHQIHYLDMTKDDEAKAMGDEFGLNLRWAEVSYALFGEALHCAATGHGDDSRLTKQLRAEAIAMMQTPVAARLVEDQKIGPDMGVRNKSVWKGVHRLAREGWKWYSSRMKTRAVDPGIKILVQPKQQSTPTLTRPIEA